MDISTDLDVLTVVMATPEAKGGAVRAGLSLGDALREYVSVDIVKMRGEDDTTLLRELNISGPVLQIPSVTIFADVLRLVSDHTNAFMWPHLTVDVTEYDIVHLHNGMPLWGMLRVAMACKYHSVPYCVTLHGVSKLPKWPDELDLSTAERYAFTITIERPYYWILNHATHLFALSETDRKTVETRLDTPSVSVVPNGVSVPPIQDRSNRTLESRSNRYSSSSDQLKSELGIDEKQPVILYVGYKRASKGVGDLLDAYEMYDGNAALVLAGPNDDEALDARIAETEGNVYDLGYVDRTKLHSLFEAADVFGFPTRSDVFPLVILEALSHGTPVVTTQVGAIPEFVDEEVGTLVNRESPKQLLTALENILEDGQMRQAMGEAGRQRVRERFSWDAVAQETVDTYERILELQR